MKPIVLYSTKSGNTQKVAEIIASELNCEALKITKNSHCSTLNLNDYDLIVIGTGIRGGNPYAEIVTFLEEMTLKHQKTFALFITWGGAGMTNQIVMNKIKEILETKNQLLVKNFYNCYGKWRFLKSGHPTEEELKEARNWIQTIIKTQP